MNRQLPLINNGQLQTYDGTNIGLSTNLTISTATINKACVTWGNGSIFTFCNGVKSDAPVTAFTGTLSLSAVQIGSGISINQLNGYIKSVRIYNTVLSDAECLRMTA